MEIRTVAMPSIPHFPWAAAVLCCGLRRPLVWDRTGYFLRVDGLRGSADAVSSKLVALVDADQVDITAICPACGYPTVRPDLCAACRPELVAE